MPDDQQGLGRPTAPSAPLDDRCAAVDDRHQHVRANVAFWFAPREYDSPTGAWLRTKQRLGSRPGSTVSVIDTQSATWSAPTVSVGQVPIQGRRHPRWHAAYVTDVGTHCMPGHHIFSGCDTMAAAELTIPVGLGLVTIWPPSRTAAGSTSPCQRTTATPGRASR